MCFVKPNVHDIQIYPKVELFIRHFISLLAGTGGGNFLQQSQYVSSVTSECARCHFLQFIDGGNQGMENKTWPEFLRSTSWLRCFPSPRAALGSQCSAGPRTPPLSPRIHGQLTSTPSKSSSTGCRYSSKDKALPTRQEWLVAAEPALAVLPQCAPTSHPFCPEGPLTSPVPLDPPEHRDPMG